MYQLPFLALLLQLLRHTQSSDAVPVILDAEANPPDIWVRDFNTLNATTWHRANSSKGGSTATSDDAPSLDVIEGSDPIATLTSHAMGTSSPSVSSYETGSPGVLSPTNQADNAGPANGVLAIDILNKIPDDNFKAYVSGLDPNGALVMLGSGGHWIYPNTTSDIPQRVAESIAIPLGKANSTLSLKLPGFLESARVWIAAVGLDFYVVATANGPGLVEPAAVNPRDPNSQVNYGFAELSWAAEYGIYADITHVDFVGLPLGIELEDANTRHSVLGAPSNAAPWLCNRLKAQAKNDGRPWDQLCTYDSSGKLIRVLAPSNLISQKPNIFGTYFSQYVNRVWTHYTKHDLIINTQASPGYVRCRVREEQLTCNGDNRGYAKPNAVDIFGCDTGPFAIHADDNAVHHAVVPRLCAAFNRGTLLLKGGNVQPGLPPSKYYSNPSSGPKNWYSKFIHEMQDEGRGYAFPYDDVAPDVGGDQSGLLSSPNPTKLRIIVGGV